MTQIDERFIVELKGKRWPTYAGVLHAATQAELTSLTTHVLQLPHSGNGNLAVVEATATFKDGRTFVDVGDASPASTSSQLASALLRLASTRAKGRCLRDAVDVGEALLEEALPDEEEPRGSQQRSPYRPPAARPVPGEPRPQESHASAPMRDSAGDQRASLLQRYAATQKRARELGLKVQVISAMKASDTEIAEAELALRAQISETENTIAARPAV